MYQILIEEQYAAYISLHYTRSNLFFSICRKQKFIMNRTLHFCFAFQELNLNLATRAIAKTQAN